MAETRRKARVMGINHVVLEVDDLDAALAFYGAVFEFELRGRGETNAFIDMGDQFIQLTLNSGGSPDAKRHFGLVVDDRSTVRAALEELGAEMIGNRLNFRDPWGNRVEVVPYDDIQFTKAEPILRGMGLDGLEKTDSAKQELAKKGLA
ncbi:MAG: VOC family protein [Defluviicoccus sp.]|nr:VOC family protein [Defluviicoccus sp.]MDE0384541.1 VOC family protein [Defluviicoccus sp.]